MEATDWRHRYRGATDQLREARKRQALVLPGWWVAWLLRRGWRGV